MFVAACRPIVAVAIAMLAVGCAGVPAAPDRQVVAELAPSGKLRTAHLVANPVLASRDAATGELRGITVDLARALAKDAGIELQPVVYTGVPAIFEAVGRGELDIVFIANDPSRAAQLDFVSSYMEVRVTYLVPVGSAVQSPADADRPGMRIAVPAKNAADLYLTRTLKSAELLRGPTTVPYLTEMMKSGKADAAAGNVLELTQVVANVPGMRIVDGGFTVISHAIAVPKGRPRAAAFVREFSERAKAAGLVEAAIRRSGIPGVSVAP